MAAHLDPHAQPLGDASDMELVEYTREGNSAAFGELWVRHSNAGRAVARSHRFDADDLLSEAFARVFQAITAGGGPTAAFRPYLFTTIRNVSMQWARAKSADASEDLDLLADPSTEEDASLAALDKSLTVNAFRSLPTRWQEALWYSEVEQLSSAEIAPLLGMKANAVSALTYRAREGLRQAWIQAHLQRTTDPECAVAIERLGSFTRGTLGTRESKRVRDHLAGCTSCTIVADEARQVGSRLALVLLPLAAGVSGAAGFLSWLQAGGGAAGGMAAAAAMPAHLSTSAAQVVAPAHLGGSSASSIAGTSNAGAAATSATGVGAAGFGAAGIVGTAVGALALAAAVVAAVTLGPGLFSPRADGATTSAEVSSDDSAAAADDSGDTAVVPAPTSSPTPTSTPTPTPTEAPAPTPKPTRPSAPANPTVPAAAPEPSAPTAPEPNVPTGQPTVPPTVEPTVPPVDPEPEALPAPIVSSVAQYQGDLSYPIYSGTGAVPGAVVRLTHDGGPLLGESTAGADGSWSIDLADASEPLDAGSYVVQIEQLVPGRAPKSTPVQGFELHAAPTLTQNAADNTFLITGAPNSTVRVFVDGSDYFGNTLPLDENGELTVSYDLQQDFEIEIRHEESSSARFGPSSTTTVVAN